MGKTTAISLRLSAKHIKMLRWLTARHGIDRTNVIRLAITRLVEEEKRREQAALPSE